MAASSFFGTTIEKVQMWRDREYPCVDLCKAVLAFIGAWQAPSGQIGVGKVCKYFLPRLHLYFSIYVIFIGLPMFGYMHKNKELQQTADLVGVEFIGSMNCYVFWCLLYRPQQLESLFSAMEAMKECSLKLPERPASILNRNRKLGEYLMYLLVFSLIVLALSIIPLPLMMIQMRKHMYEQWFPFDEKVSPAYEIVLVLNIFCHFMTMSGLIAFHIMRMSMCLEARGQFRLLAHNLASVKNVRQGENGRGNITFNERTEASLEVIAVNSSTDRRDPNQEIKACVQHHYAILSFVKRVESTFDIHLFLFMACSLIPAGLGILLLFYDDTNDQQLVRVFQIIGSNMGTALCCWLGDELTIEDEAVREAMYDCDWFDQSESFKRSMRIIMARTNQPVVVRVAGFVPLSLETYYSMMKLTYSYIMTMWEFFQTSAA